MDDKANLRRIEQLIRITKITCTRAIKSPRGDSFVGFSASWDSLDSEIPGIETSQGLPLEDARLARILLSKECDLAALEAAFANGSVSSEYFRESSRAIQNNYDQIFLQETSKKDPP